jgi:thiamine pyrophosphate-dependent acetolactate synthase large subunit-like protein
MRDLVDGFISQSLSRREFVHSLGAIGVSAAGIAATVRSAEAVTAGAFASGTEITGTGGELMVEQMKAAGVKYLFTNPGSFEVGFFDAFLDQPMQLIMGLHEGIVISAADGYNKVTGEPAFVNVHVIAGTAQAAGQMYNASRDGSALIVTAGLLDNERGDDDILLGARPGFDQKEVNRQFTKISWEGHDSAGIPTMLRRAFKVATTAPGGPVYLAFPNHVLERRDVTGTIFPRETFLLPDEIPPNQDDVDQVARLLLEARSPTLHLGDEVSRSGAQAEAFELAELLHIPVGDQSMPAYHNFPRRHPLFAGRHATEGKDLVIHAGVTDTSMGSASSGTTVVCIGLDTTAMGSNHPFDLAMVANVKMALRALIDSIRSQATDARIASIVSSRRAPDRWYREIQPDRIGMSPIHPDELGWALDEELDRDAIVVTENLSGSNDFLSTGFREDEKMWLSTSGAGLGWGIGAATGAKLGQPDRQVVCNIGDGSVMYSASGFWSQARYGVPVLTVVCNNLNYQTVRNAYVRYGGKMRQENRFTGMYLGDPEIDFVKLAGSQGIEGAVVENSAELRPALRRGIDATREGSPYLVDVRVRRTGGGADSTWHQAFDLAEQRTRRV